MSHAIQEQSSVITVVMAASNSKYTRALANPMRPISVASVDQESTLYDYGAFAYRITTSERLLARPVCISVAAHASFSANPSSSRAP